MILDLPFWANLLLATAVYVLGSARITRLFVHDIYPPVAWIRMKWDDLTDGSGWNALFHCHWCFAPYVTVVTAAVFALGLVVPWVAWTWWIGMGILSASYLAAMVVERDSVE